MESSDSNVDIEDLQRRFLECPVCFNLFNNNDRHPRVLPCLHSYCYVCLQQLIQESQFNCPLCKSDFYVNNINVDLFPKDNTRRDLLDFVRAGGDTSVIQCEECRNDRAISRCKDCHKFICRTCCTAHETMQTFHGHSVFGLDDFQLSMDQVPKFRHSLMCKKHPKYELNFFCDGPECQKPICLTCCLCFHTNRPENNQNHITREIEAVYHEKVEKMQNKKVKINKTEQELVVLSKNINEQIDKLALNTENITQEIEAIFGVAADMLQRRKDALIATAEKLKTDKETLLMKQEIEVKSSISTIRDACTFIDQTIASENQPAFILLSETISDRLGYLQDTHYDKQPRDSNLILFSKTNLGADFQRFVDSVGNISSSVAYGPNTKLTYPLEIKKGKEFEIMIEFFNYDNGQIEDEMTVTAIFFETPESSLTSIGELSFSHRGNGKYQTSSIITDTSITKLTKMIVKTNSEDFYTVDLEIAVSKGLEEDYAKGKFRLKYVNITFLHLKANTCATKSGYNYIYIYKYIYIFNLAVPFV